VLRPRPLWHHDGGTWTIYGGVGLGMDGRGEQGRGEARRGFPRWRTGKMMMMGGTGYLLLLLLLLLLLPPCWLLHAGNACCPHAAILHSGRRYLLAESSATAVLFLFVHSRFHPSGLLVASRFSPASLQIQPDGLLLDIEMGMYERSLWCCFVSRAAEQDGHDLRVPSLLFSKVCTH